MRFLAAALLIGSFGVVATGAVAAVPDDTSPGLRNIESKQEGWIKVAKKDSKKSRSSKGPYDEPIVYPVYTGPKKTIAVLDFENKTKGAYGSREIGSGMAEMLTTELINTGRYIVVERQALQEILGEQQLGQTGLVGGGAPRVGGLAGAQLLIKGVVSEFKYKAGGGGFGVGFKGVDLGAKTKKAHVGVDVRLIDASSGQVLDSRYVKASAKASGFDIGYDKVGDDFSIGTGAFDATPLGEATRKAIREAVAYINERNVVIRWSGSVIRADGDKIYINRGRNSNIQVGNVLTVFAKGEELYDPDTGIYLGCEETRLGNMTVSQVQDKFSIGRLAMDPGVVGACSRGDIVRFPD